MPVNGLIFQADQYLLGVGVNSSWSGTGKSFTATLQSLWTPDAVDIDVGLQIVLNGNEQGWNGNIECPNAPFGGYVVSGSGLASSVEVDLALVNYRLYGANPAGQNYLFHVFVDSMNVLVNGSVVGTLAGWDMLSNGLGPSWVPLFCGLVSITGTSAIDSGSCSSTTFGGYKFLKGGKWYAMPTAIIPPSDEVPLSGPAIPYSYGTKTAPFGLSTAGICVSGSTWGPQITTTNTNLTGYGTRDAESCGGTIILIPDLAKAYVRMNPDYAASWHRFVVPLTQALSQRTFSHRFPNADPQPPSYFVGPGSGFNPLTANVTTRQNEGAEEVGFTPDAFESCMAIHSYSITSAGATKFVAQEDGQQDEENFGSEFPSNMDADIAPYMQHESIIANYFNSPICHPHWSFGYNAGPWNLGGAPVAGEAYWFAIGEQYLSAQQRRNTLISDPVGNTGWAAFLDAYFAKLRWIGVSRWKTQDVVPLTFLTLDSTSAAAWIPESTSCTLTFGSVITVTPTSSVNCSFDLDLARFDCQPWMYASLAATVFLNWSTTNIKSVLVEAKSSDGTTLSSLLLNPTDTATTANQTYPMPNTSDAKYAGSWGINNGNGVANDQGLDVPAGGISATLMNDDRRQMAFGLLGASQAAFLRFAIVVSDKTQPCTIFYPKFTAATVRQLVQENAQVADVIYKNGPGVRWSNHVWYSGQFWDPPLNTGLGYKPSVIDWLCDKRILLQATSPTGGTPSLATECTQLYDSFEGNSIGQVDDNSIVFQLPPNPSSLNEPDWKAALVNTWSEVPPLAAFPAFDRDPKTWQAKTPLNPVQYAWTWAQLNRYIVTPGSNAVDLVKPDGTTVVTTPATSLPGWTITQHTTTTTGNELVNWLIKKSGATGVTYAHVTPWHGYYCVLNIRNPHTISSDVARHGRHVIAWVKTRASDGKQIASLMLSTNADPKTYTNRDTSIVCSALAVRWTKGAAHALQLMYIDGSSAVQTCYSYDEGQTWSMPTQISSSGTIPAFVVADSGTRFYYWITSNGTGYKIQGQVQNALGTVVIPTFDAISFVDAASGLSVDESYGNQGAHSIRLVYASSGAITASMSPNGKDFS